MSFLIRAVPHGCDFEVTICKVDSNPEQIAGVLKRKKRGPDSRRIKKYSSVRIIDGQEQRRGPIPPA